MVKIVFAGLLSGVLCQPDGAVKKYARGFHRMNSNAIKKVAVITDEMRAAAPASLDWAAKGALTAVKDQGQCGSCWAYSATEGIEAGLFMATGQKIKLSEQQIISCDKDDLGCDGGDLPTAFDYVKNNGGIDTQSDYPDTSSSKGRDGKCNKKASKVVKVTDYEYAIPPCPSGTACKNQKESDLKAALNSFGPLSVCVNAEDWDDYSRGIYTKKCSGKEQNLDHCVQLVGYDTTGSQSYWKVRNSWASDWGEDGFIRLPMGENACGIADEAMYVKAEMVSLEAEKHCHIEEDAGMSKVVVDDIFNCTVNFQGTCTDCKATDATATSGGHQVSCKAGDGNWYNANCPEATVV